MSELIKETYERVSLGDYGKRIFAFFGPSAPVTIGIHRESPCQTRSIEVKLLYELTYHALQSQFLRVGQDCLVQTQGVLIGSQLGPPLCSIALARAERVWNRGLRSLPVKHLPICVGRYVDNRLTLIAVRGGSVSPMASHFFDPLFYPKPVQFEPEPGTDALGVTLQPRLGLRAISVEMIPLVPGFEHVWSFLCMGEFPPPHSPCLARYQSWHTYCAFARFRGWWVGRCILAIDSMTQGVDAVVVLAKLALTLAASFLCCASPSNKSVCRECFLLLSKAFRAAGLSRPGKKTQCNFLAKSLARSRMYGSAIDCVQTFLASNLSSGGTLRQAIERGELQ